MEELIAFFDRYQVVGMINSCVLHRPAVHRLCWRNETGPATMGRYMTPEKTFSADS